MADAIPLLEANEITVKFGEFTAVTEVSLRVAPGQIVGLIGPNGAGKTALMNAIAGVHRPAHGDVRLRGESLRRQSPSRRAHLGIARTFQNIELFGSMTVYENVITHADAVMKSGNGLFGWLSRGGNGGAGGQTKRSRAFEILERLELLPIADCAVSELSYPERKIVEFGRAMVADIDLVLLDEPTAGVAIEERRALIARMHEHMLGRNVAAVVVEHDMDVIRRLSDYVYVMDGGALIAQGSFESVVADERVKEAYLGIAVDDI